MLKTAAAIAGILLTAGCARTVHRLPRAPILPARSTLTACEQKNWIVLAPTRASVVHEKTGRTRLQDGAGVYAIGSDTPLDITDLPKHNEPSPIIERKQEEVASHDTRGHVRDTYGRIGLVDVLTSGSAGSESVHAKVGGAHVDFFFRSPVTRG